MSIIILEYEGEKMKKFNKPIMTIKRLEVEEVVRTSEGCWEMFDCKKCYNDAVICSGYTCTGLECGCLGRLHI